MEKIKLLAPYGISISINNNKLKTIVIETGNENIYLPYGKFIVTKDFLATSISVFSFCDRLIMINMEDFDFSEITTMRSWFFGCKNLSVITFPNRANLNKLESLNGCFNGTAIREIDLSFMETKHLAINFQHTFFKSQVKKVILPKCTISNLEGCFSQCDNLREIIATENIRLNDANVLYTTFSDCTNLNLINFSDSNFNNKDFVNIVQAKENLNNIPEDCVIVLP